MPALPVRASPRGQWGQRSHVAAFEAVQYGCRDEAAESPQGKGVPSSKSILNRPMNCERELGPPLELDSPPCGDCFPCCRCLPRTCVPSHEPGGADQCSRRPLPAYWQPLMLERVSPRALRSLELGSALAQPHWAQHADPDELFSARKPEARFHGLGRPGVSLGTIADGLTIQFRGLVACRFGELGLAEQARTFDEAFEPRHALLHVTDAPVQRSQPTHDPERHRHLHAYQGRPHRDDADEFRAHGCSLSAGSGGGLKLERQSDRNRSSNP